MQLVVHYSNWSSYELKQTDLLSIGSWKVTCVAAVAAAAAVIAGLVGAPLPRWSVVPLPSGGRLLLSDMALPYTGSLSEGRVVTAAIPCCGRGPPSTGDRTLLPILPRGADGDGFCWLGADWAELVVEVPSAGRLLRATVPACDRATNSCPPVSYTVKLFDTSTANAVTWSMWWQWKNKDKQLHFCKAIGKWKMASAVSASRIVQ